MSHSEASNNAGEFSDLIDRSNPKHVEFLNQQKRIYSDAADYFVQETNETERSLSAQLVLVNTVLITGSLVAMTNKDLLAISSDPVKLIMLLSLFYLVISIFIGIKYYFTVMKYNYTWAQAKRKSMDMFLDGSVTTWSELRSKTTDLQIRIPQKQDNLFLRLQILLLASASIYFFVALIGLLFNVQELFTQMKLL